MLNVTVVLYKIDDKTNQDRECRTCTDICGQITLPLGDAFFDIVFCVADVDSFFRTPASIPKDHRYS